MLLLTDMQKVGLTISPVDGAGNPAPVEGVPAWTVSDESLATLEVAADGLSATVITVGPLGSCQVSVTADADLGEGVTPITGILDIEIVASQAVSMGIAAGTPEPR